MKAIGIIALSLWIAAILDHGVSQRIAIFGATPNFLLIIPLVVGLTAQNPAAVWTGFFAGLTQACLIGANLTQFVVSRIAGSFVTARLGALDVEIGVVLAGIFVGFGSLLSDVVLMFLAPPRSIPDYLRDTITSGLYNAVLALPIYAVLRPFLSRKETVG